METMTVALLGGAVVLLALVGGAFVLRARRSAGGSTASIRTTTATSTRDGTSSTTTETARSSGTSAQSPSTGTDAKQTRHERGSSLSADVEKQLTEPASAATTTTGTTGTTASSATTADESGSLDDLWDDSTTMAGGGEDLDAASEALLNADDLSEDDWSTDADATTGDGDELFASTGESSSEDYRAANPDGDPDDDLDSLFS